MKAPASYLVTAILASAAFSPAARADDLQYLDHSELALSRLYTDIAGAESSIDLSYLIWDPCSSVTKVLLRQLAGKAHPKDKTKKPVKVRVLLDSFFQRGKLEALQAEFDRAGIEARFFNAANPMSNFHTHSKLTLVDRKVAGKARFVTGGRNISDEYFGMSKHNYVDRDVSVTGASSTEDPKGTVAQAGNAFDRLWANPKTQPVAKPQSGPAPPLECARWTPKDQKLDQYLRENAARIVAQEKPVSCGSVAFTMDDMSHASLPLGERARAKPTSQAVLRLVSQATKALTMENQYFIPDQQNFRPWLRDRKAHHVKVDVYSNMFDKDQGVESLFDKNNFEMVSLWQREAMRGENGNGETNHMNFRIAGALDRWAFSPPETNYTYHAKTFVADSKDAIVSSFNIDPRSMSINGESALSVRDCPAFAKKVEGVTKLTGKVWTLEENLHVCLTGNRPKPPAHDPVTHMLEFFTRDLQ